MTGLPLDVRPDVERQRPHRAQHRRQRTAPRRVAPVDDAGGGDAGCGQLRTPPGQRGEQADQPLGLLTRQSPALDRHAAELVDEGSRQGGHRRGRHLPLTGTEDGVAVLGEQPEQSRLVAGAGPVDLDPHRPPGRGEPQCARPGPDVRLVPVARELEPGLAQALRCPPAHLLMEGGARPGLGRHRRTPMPPPPVCSATDRAPAPRRVGAVDGRGRLRRRRSSGSCCGRSSAGS